MSVGGRVSHVSFGINSKFSYWAMMIFSTIYHGLYAMMAIFIAYFIGAYGMNLSYIRQVLLVSVVGGLATYLFVVEYAWRGGWRPRAGMTLREAYASLPTWPWRARG